MYQIEITSGPSSEPVTTAELKLLLRLNNSTTEDALLSELITTARTIFENLTLRCLGTQTVKQHLQSWPYGYGRHDGYGYGQWEYYGPPYPSRTEAMILLARSPVQSVTTFHYTDSDGAGQTFTDYDSDLVSVPARLVPHSRPAVSMTTSPVAYVTYQAGWTTIPSPVKTAVKQLAAHFYREREAYTDKKFNDLPMGFMSVVNQYKTGMSGGWGQ